MKKFTLFLALFLFGIISAVNAQTITRSGTKFYKDGAEIWFNGANTPWNSWNDFGGSYSHTWWDAEFQRLKAAKINMTRVWISCNGDVQPAISSDGTVTGVSSAFWSNVDDLAAIASTYQIYVLPTLMSFDHPSNYHGNYMSWRNMLNNQTKVQTYIDNYLKPFVQRYNNNKYFFAIDICNEPEWINQNATAGQLSVATLQRFAAMCAAAIHNNSSKMATVGSACVKWNSPTLDGNWWSDANLKAANGNNSASYLDFWQVHYYNWQFPYYGAPFSKSLSTYGTPTDRPTICGEGPGKADSGYTITQMYQNTWANGFAGYCSWTSNGVDANGTLTDFSGATTTFYNNHPTLVYPGGGSVAVTSVSVSPTSASIAVNATKQLTATVLPTNATNKSVTWTTSSSTIATVSTSGLVTGKAAGSATITVKTVDGGKTATCAITVTSGGGGTNLLANPGFETTANWTIPSPFSRSTTSKRTGSYSLKLVGVGGWADTYQTISVTANTNYNYSLYINGTAKIYMAVYNTGWTNIASVTKTPTSSWVQYTLSFNSGSNTQVIITIQDAGTGTSYIDDASVIDPLKSASLATSVNPVGSDKIMIYPNPLDKSNLRLNVSGLSAGNFEVAVFDVQGRTVYQNQLKVSGAITQLQLENMNQGMYIMKVVNINNSQIVLNQKLVVR